jgi:general secretion pathway protein G
MSLASTRTLPRASLRRRAFTLIELLVVITIIGIIGTVVTVNVIQYVDNARETKAREMIIQLKTTCDSYRIHKSTYPSDLEKLTEPSKKNGDEPYLKNVPKDPYGEEFIYKVDGKKIEIISKGLDRQEGTEDDITLEKIESGEYQEEE